MVVAVVVVVVGGGTNEVLKKRKISKAKKLGSFSFRIIESFSLVKL